MTAVKHILTGLDTLLLKKKISNGEAGGVSAFFLLFSFGPSFSANLINLNVTLNHW